MVLQADLEVVIRGIALMSFEKGLGEVILPLKFLSECPLTDVMTEGSASPDRLEVGCSMFGRISHYSFRFHLLKH